MKSIIAAGLLLGCAHGAIAGPYANIENKAKFTGDVYGGTTTEAHAGYDFGAFQVQAGPAFINPRGEAGRAEWSGKVKAATKLSEDLKLYGEVSFITEDKDFSLKNLTSVQKLE